MTDKDAGSPEHNVRRSLFSSERHFSLTPEALVWSAAKRSERIPYADIGYVHIYSMPPTFGRIVRRTVLKGKFRGKLMIAATHFRGIGRFEDRSASYLPFVEALLSRATAANPSVRIVAGLAGPLYIFWTVMLGVSAVILAGAAIAAATGAFPTHALPSLIIILVLLPVSWRIARRGRPRRADAGALYSSDLATDTARKG